MLKGLRNMVIIAGVIGGGAYVFYHYVLSDRARNGLTFAANAVKESTSIIYNTVDSYLGLVVNEQDSDQNAEITEQRWNRIGY